MQCHLKSWKLKLGIVVNGEGDGVVWDLLHDRIQYDDNADDEGDELSLFVCSSTRNDVGGKFFVGKWESSFTYKYKIKS